MGKTVEDTECPCHNKVPGILFPIDIHGTAGNKYSEDGRVLVERCDDCSIFRSDEDAAYFLVAATGAVLKRWYDEGSDKYFHWCLDMTLEKAVEFHLDPETHTILTRKEKTMNKICFYCGEPLEQKGIGADWCWIKTGLDDYERLSEVESIKVHDTCAAPLVMEAKRKKEITDGTPAFIEKVKAAGIKTEDMFGVISDLIGNTVKQINDGGLEKQISWLREQGYDLDGVLNLANELKEEE